MTIQRDIPSTVREQIERQETSEFVLIFLTISHPMLTEPIRVVSDPENFIYGGKEYVGFNFDITLLNDDDRPPRARLSVQNVDRIIGQTVLNAVNPARVDIKVISGDQFDLSVSPRQPIGEPALMYHAQQLYLTEVDGNPAVISGTLRSWDYTQEVWPGIRSTETRTPGLYW